MRLTCRSSGNEGPKTLPTGAAPPTAGGSRGRQPTMTNTEETNKSQSVTGGSNREMEAVLREIESVAKGEPEQ